MSQNNEVAISLMVVRKYEVFVVMMGRFGRINVFKMFVVKFLQ